MTHLASIGHPRYSGGRDRRDVASGVPSGSFDTAHVIGADKLRATTSENPPWKWKTTGRDMAWDCTVGSTVCAGFGRYGGPRISMSHNIGGLTPVSAVTVLEGPGADGV